MGFYSVTPLTPGGWAQLLDEAGLPHSLRRLSDTIALGHRRRQVDFRCLSMLAALAYLLDDPPAGQSASVRAWRLAARVVEQSVLAGGRRPDLGRFSAAFPATAHAVVGFSILEEDELPAPADPEQTVSTFVEAATHALAAAVREPKLLTAPDAHAEVLDLARLQPSLRAVAPIWARSRRWCACATSWSSSWCWSCPSRATTAGLCGPARSTPSCCAGPPTSSRR